MKKVYLDFNATTPVDAELVQALPSLVQIWGNPSSVHWAGQAVKGKIRDSRSALAKLLNVSPLEIIFTSGGSESNNSVLFSFFNNCKASSKNEFITTTIEHPSIAKTFQHFADNGCLVHRIGFDKQGNFDFASFEKVLSERTALVSCMLANNETGLVIPIKKITELAHTRGVLVHTDSVQALGKSKVDLKDLDVDFASFSAHKFYALKGAGALFVKKGIELQPLIMGGGQERHRRGGTENTLGISAMGFMAEKMLKENFLEDMIASTTKNRNKFEELVKHKISEVDLTHKNAERLCNTSSVVIHGVDGEALLMALDVKGYAVSTGSACSSGSSQPSAALIAFGLKPVEARSSLRVSIGWSTSEEELQNFVEILSEIVTRLRRLDVQERVI